MREERDRDIWKYYQESLHNCGHCKEIKNFSEFHNFYYIWELTWVGKPS